MLALGACGATHTSPERAAAAGDPGTIAPPVTRGAAEVAPHGMLTARDARRYMVKLINRDRASMGVGSVVFDEGAPTAAGQEHAEDMASHGYLGHWGTDGSVPEERYTRQGGADMVLENASSITDERARTLDRDPRIDPREVEKTESMFFNETPPNDGHRKNILKFFHTRVGIGVAQPLGTALEVAVPCFTQEFVDAYGTYATLPSHMHVGDTLRIAGTLKAPAQIVGVGLARIGTPHPLAVAEVNRRRSYPIPPPYQMYWPPGFVTPIPLDVNGNEFSISVPVSDGGHGGLYEVSVWAKMPGAPDDVMVSLRTLRVQ